MKELSEVKQKVDGPHACNQCGKWIPRKYAESHKKTCKGKRK